MADAGPRLLLPRSDCRWNTGRLSCLESSHGDDITGPANWQPTAVGREVHGLRGRGQFFRGSSMRVSAVCRMNVHSQQHITLLLDYYCTYCFVPFFFPLGCLGEYRVNQAPGTSSAIAAHPGICFVVLPAVGRELFNPALRWIDNIQKKYFRGPQLTLMYFPHRMYKHACLSRIPPVPTADWGCLLFPSCSSWFLRSARSAAAEWTWASFGGAQREDKDEGEGGRKGLVLSRPLRAEAAAAAPGGSDEAQPKVDHRSTEERRELAKGLVLVRFGSPGLHACVQNLW